MSMKLHPLMKYRKKTGFVARIDFFALKKMLEPRLSNLDFPSGMVDLIKKLLLDLCGSKISKNSCLKTRFIFIYFIILYHDVSKAK